MSDSVNKDKIVTPWWKILLLVIFSAVSTYILAYSLMYIRHIEPVWAAPIISLSKKYNPNLSFEKPPYDLQELFYKWDSHYYLEIATSGYNQIPFSTDKPYNWAFFPLYPLIIKITSLPIAKLTQNILLVVGMLISNAFLFLGLLVWKEIAKILKLSQNQWRFFLLLLFTFPLSYAFHLVFTESLFFFLSSLAILLMIRKNYIGSSWLVGLAAATRITGIIFIPFVIFLYLRDNYRKLNLIKDLAWVGGLLLIMLTPILTFFNYLNLVTGEPLAPLKIQAAWNNDKSYPFVTIVSYFKDYGLSFFPDHALSIILLLLCWLLLLWQGARLVKNYSKSKNNEWLLLLITAFLVLLNSSISSRSSMFRYTITIPYLFVTLSYLFSNKYMGLFVLPTVVLFLLLKILFFSFFLWYIPIYGF